MLNLSKIVTSSYLDDTQIATTMASASTRKKKSLLMMILLGDSGVGKTSVLRKFVHNEFLQEYKATIGADILTKELEIGDILLTLQIWDTAGQERFQSLGHSFYRGSDACGFVYDITNQETFNNIDTWRSNFVTQYSLDYPERFPFLLLGNKIDKHNLRQVDRIKGEKYAQEHNMLFFETSALSGESVNEAITQLATRTIRWNTAPPLSIFFFVVVMLLCGFVVLLIDIMLKMRKTKSI